MTKQDDYRKKRDLSKKRFDANLNKMFKVFPKIQWGQVESLYAKFLMDYRKDSVDKSMAFDSTYRIYHSSFKMYRMTEDIFNMWDLLFKAFNFNIVNDNDLELKLLGERVIEKDVESGGYEYYSLDNKKLDNNEVLLIKREVSRLVFDKKYKNFISNIKKLGATELLLKQFKTLRNCYFTMSKNNNGDWMKDSLNMKSNLEISRELVESTFYYLYREYLGEGEIHNEASRTLSSSIALVMETLMALSFRYGSLNRDENKLEEMKLKVVEKIEKSKQNKDKDFQEFYSIIEYEISQGKDLINMAPKFSTYDFMRDANYERAMIRYNNSQKAKEQYNKIINFGILDYNKEESERSAFITLSPVTRYRGR